MSERPNPSDLREKLAALVPGRAWPEEPAALLAALAEAAPVVEADLAPLSRRVAAFLDDAGPVTFLAAGAALWRVTWQVCRTWLDGIDPGDPSVPAAAPLLLLAADVLTEHLGRRPDVAPKLARVLARLSATAADGVPGRVGRLVRLGPAAWGVLLGLLREPGPVGVKRAALRAARQDPRLLRMAHPVAPRVVAARADNTNAVPQELIEPACAVLEALGPDAGTALPDLLRLVRKEPGFATVVADAVLRVAPGYPLAAAALVRVLEGLRGQWAGAAPEFRSAFHVLAGCLFALNPDAAPALVDDTGVDAAAVDALLGGRWWQQAPPADRERHLRAVADRLGSPRAVVRERAAALLRHYLKELPAVWPALVAALTGPDDPAGHAVLPYFRALAPAADAVEAELAELLRDTNPLYAARALFALWRLGRLPDLGDEVRAAALADPPEARSGKSLRRALRGAAGARGFADPDAVADRLLGLFRPPETEEDRKLGALLPDPDEPGGLVTPDWPGLEALAGGDRAAFLLTAAAVACHGPAGLEAKKIACIKAVRSLAGFGLAQAKGAIENGWARLTRPPDREAVREGIRTLFENPAAPPEYIREAVHHPACWGRWAALVLLDGWHPLPAELLFAAEERTFDPSPRVRGQALRLTRG